MRGLTTRYELLRPHSLVEALAMRAAEGPALKPFAGGTDLMVSLEAGTLKDRRFLDLSRLAELRQVSLDGDQLVIGAMVTYTQLARHPLVIRNFPNIVQAAVLTGARAIQNRGTLGGNIANASPAADTPPALLTYDAEIELGSVRGRRRLPYCEFHTGYKQTLMGPDEIITAIVISTARQGTLRHGYVKVGTRSAQAISKVVFSASGSFDGGVCHSVRLAFGSVAPKVLRAQAAEDLLLGKVWTVDLVNEAVLTIAATLSPIDDIRSSAAYRLGVSSNVAARVLSQWARQGANSVGLD